MADSKGGGASTKALAAFYAAYFCYVGLFSPYCGLWLSALGFGAAEIGVLMSPMQLTRIFGPPFWGWIADHSRHASRVLLAGSVLAALFCIPLLMPMGFVGLFLTFLALSFFLSGQVPIAESLTLDAVHGDLGKYGRLRLWGSIGFIAAVVFAGPILDAQGLDALPWMMLAALVVVCFSAVALRPAPHSPSTVHLQKQRLREALMRRSVWWLLLSAFAMVFAHSALYGFFSLWLERAGYTRTEIGFLWALGVVAEIVIFQYQHRLFAAFKIERLLIGSFWVAVLRFAMIGLIGPGLINLLLVQLMHAATFGVHHSASVSLIRTWFPPHAQARAQAIYVVAAYGLGGSLGGVFAGWIWEAWSPDGVFVVASIVSALGVVAAMLAFRAREQESIQQALPQASTSA